MTSPLAKAYIWAAKLNRERAEFTAWMEKQKPRIERFLPDAEAMVVMDEARRLWRAMEPER